MERVPAGVPGAPPPPKDGTEANPREWREYIRQGAFRGHTAGLCAGFAQANLLVLPASYAFAFEEFCDRNAQACPLLERLTPGDPRTRIMADGADIRTDLPRYHVFSGDSLLAEVENLVDVWRDDLVGFLMGCSFTFEWALAREGVLLHHVLQDKTVPMYRTNIPLIPVGPFKGHLVVSMRYVPFEMYRRVATVTARYPKMHGEPVHHGEAGAIGIRDLDHPDFGEAVEQPQGTVPVFWACGVTSRVAATHAAPPRWMAHAPGHMLILDRRHEAFEERPSAG